MKHALIAPLTALALTALGACSGPLSDGPTATAAAFNDAFRDTPFADGAPISVIVNDPDPLRKIGTYSFVPCQQGKAVCAGSVTGQAGTLTLEDGQYVVRGTYPGRVFYLDRGGDGFMGVDGVLVPLAWN